MSMIFMITPETGNAKSDRAAAVNACGYFRMGGVAISPVLTLDYLDSDDWLRDADGRVTECSDDDILRFIEKIEIGWQTVTVTFKAGISVELPREA